MYSRARKPGHASNVLGSDTDRYAEAESSPGEGPESRTTSRTASTLFDRDRGIASSLFVVGWQVVAAPRVADIKPPCSPVNLRLQMERVPGDWGRGLRSPSDTSPPSPITSCLHLEPVCFGHIVGSAGDGELGNISSKLSEDGTMVALDFPDHDTARPGVIPAAELLLGTCSYLVLVLGIWPWGLDLPCHRPRSWQAACPNDAEPQGWTINREPTPACRVGTVAWGLVTMCLFPPLPENLRRVCADRVGR